ncbi:MAG: hypothetical protein M0C28_43355 [Candidatus Moduliflexus flocculans]|nr:hypothetical protein [Candidatus Moduliflexus flocculans]
MNGLYKPAAREIILHNRNFDDDLQLVYTALHEYAHHLHRERTGFRVHRPRPYQRVLVHLPRLPEKAEALGHYRNVFEDSRRFSEPHAKRSNPPAWRRTAGMMLEFGPAHDRGRTALPCPQGPVRGLRGPGARPAPDHRHGGHEGRLVPSAGRDRLGRHEAGLEPEGPGQAACRGRGLPGGQEPGIR